MGLINREMASRRKRYLWGGTFRTGSVLAEPFETNSKITSVFDRLLESEL
jgi:hypothetical protein